MVPPRNDIISRIEFVIGDWKSEVAGAHQGLTQQIAETNSQLAKILQLLETRSDHLTALSAAKSKIERLEQAAPDGDLPPGALTQYSATAVAADDALQKQLRILERLAATVSLWKQEVTQSHAGLAHQLEMSNSQFAQMLTLIAPDAPAPPVKTERNESAALVRKQEETIRNQREAKVELLQKVQDLSKTIAELRIEYDAKIATQSVSDDNVPVSHEASEKLDEQSNALQAALEEADQRTNTLRDEKAALETELDLLKNATSSSADLQALAFQRDTLQETLTDLESQLNALQKQDRERTDSAQALLEELQSAQQAEENQSAALQQAQDEATSLREQLTQQKSDRDAQQQANTNLEQQLADREQQLTQAQAQIPSEETKQAQDDLGSQLRAHEDKLQTAQAHISDLEMRLEESKEPSDEPIETEAAGREQCELLKVEIERLNDAEDHRAHALAEARSEVEARRQDLVERENEIARLNDRIEETASTIQQLRDEIASAIQAGQDAVQRSGESKREIDTARADLHAKDELLAEGAHTVEGYQDCIEQQEDAIETLKSEKENLANEVVQLQQRTAQLTTEQNDLSSELVSLRDETGTKQEGLSEARSTVDAQQLALEERTQNIATLGDQVHTLEILLVDIQQREQYSITVATELRDALEAMRTTEEPRAQALQESRETIREIRAELSERIGAVDTLTTRCKELEGELNQAQELTVETSGDSPTPDEKTSNTEENDATAAALAEARNVLAEQQSKLNDGDNTISALQDAFEALDGQLTHVKSESAAHREGMRHAIAEMNQVIQERDLAREKLDTLNDDDMPQTSAPEESTKSAAQLINLQDRQQRIVLSEFSELGDQRPLGEILFAADVISQVELRLALKEQRNVPSQLLGAIIANMNFASLECIAQAVACQLNLPLIIPTKNIVGEEAANLVDKDICTWHVFIPIRIIENKLLVAMANPLDKDAIELIKDLTHLDVSPVIATANDILVAVDHVYSSG